jgi:hypothetical protein
MMERLPDRGNGLLTHDGENYGVLRDRLTQYRVYSPSAHCPGNSPLG